MSTYPMPDELAATWPAYPQGPPPLYGSQGPCYGEGYSVNPTMLMGGPSSGRRESWDPTEAALQRRRSQQWYPDSQVYERQDHSSFQTAPDFSPPPTASFSSPDSSASSYSGLISPRSLSSSGSVVTPPLSSQSCLLPAADVSDDAYSSAAADKSWFGELQETYLQQHQHQQSSCGISSLSSPITPTHYVPPPNARYRSPAPSSPASPYSAVVTPVSASRRNSTASIGASESPRRGRRQSRLSIAVPPYSIPPSPHRQMGTQDAPASAVPIPPHELPVLPASTEDMDRLMLEITTILGPEVMASLESPQAPPPPPLPSHQQQQHQHQHHQHQPRTPSRGRRVSHNGMIEMAGMTLSRQDLDMLEDAELDPYRHYPASAPAWQTSFPALPHHQHRYPHYPLPPPQQHGSFYSEPQYSNRPPPYQYPQSPSRPSSAPGHRRSDPRAPAPSPLAASAGPRRRSSLDSPSFDSPATFAVSAPHQPPVVSPARVKSRRRTQSARQAETPKNMFINFTQSDSKKLLSGVAPSGSSKRKREEEAAAAAAAAALQAYAA